MKNLGPQATRHGSLNSTRDSTRNSTRNSSFQLSRQRGIDTRHHHGRMHTGPWQQPLRKAGQAAALCGLLLLAGCTALTAQNPASALKPVNAVADGSDERLMLKGYDVVSYFTQNRHQLGTPQFKSVYEGVTFRFASAEHKTLFDAQPTRYLPQYGGYCANGLVYGIPWGGDGDTWLIVDGKLYINGGAGSKAAFLLDVPGHIKLADKYWAEEVKGNNSFLQRAKRLVFRVPHYKSGEELDRLVKAAASKKG